jgi:hypothetical protein
MKPPAFPPKPATRDNAAMNSCIARCLAEPMPPVTAVLAAVALSVAATLPQPAAAVDLPRIVAPDAQQVVHSNAGTVRVAVTGAPPGGWLRPVLDERPLPLQRPPAFELHDVDRGTHTLRVHVLDAREQLVAMTRPVEFHVWQASRRLP